MEWLTDIEKRILLSALTREKKVCIEVDKECKPREPYEQSLESVCKSLEHKFMYDRLFKQIYNKGFMDGVNDQAERYKNSVYRQEHDSELLDKVAHELKETFNTECPINYTSTQPFFTLENVRTLIDMVVKEMKAEME